MNATPSIMKHFKYIIYNRLFNNINILDVYTERLYYILLQKNNITLYNIYLLTIPILLFTFAFTFL